MTVARAFRRTLLASYTAGLVTINFALLYVNPWGVPRIAAGILIGSLVVAVAAGKFLKARCASTDRGDVCTLAPERPVPALGDVNPTRVLQSWAVPSPDH